MDQLSFILTIVSLVIGVIALVVSLVTLPSAFQMWWGRAKPKSEFRDNRQDNACVLLCEILNAPIRSGFLHSIGVKRDALIFQCFCSISEIGTNKIVVRDQRLLITYGKNHAEYIGTIYPGTPAYVGIIKCSDLGNYVITDDDEKINIPQGEYKIKLTLVYDSVRAEKEWGIHLDKNFRTSNWRDPAHV